MSRTTKQVLAVGAVTFLIFAGAAMNTSVLTVDVETADAPRMVIPVPVPVAQAALVFAPDEAKRVEVPELARYLPHVQRALGALREAPDARLVGVRDRGDHVEISKEDDRLRIRVREAGDGARVDVDVPLAAAEAALRAYDRESGTFDTGELVSVLRSAPRGNLVHVLDGTDEVTIEVW